MGHIGAGELLVILIIALLIFGPKQLPRLGKTLGKTLGEFKHYVDSSTNWDLDDEDEESEKKTKVKKTVREGDSGMTAAAGSAEAAEEKTVDPAENIAKSEAEPPAEAEGQHTETAGAQEV